MYLLVKTTKLHQLQEALKMQRIYSMVVPESAKRVYVQLYVDIETPQDAYYTGRWVGRNCSTDEIMILTNKEGMGV